MIQAILQTSLSLGGVTLVRANGSSTRYRSSADTDLARGTALATARTAAAAGDAIFLGPGTHDIGTAVLDLSGDGATGVHLSGCGTRATTIKSQAILGTHGCIVKPGNGSVISRLTIEGNAAGGIYQGCVGTATAASQTIFANAVLDTCRLIADSDGLYVNHASACSITCHDCLIETKYDCVASFTGAHLIRLYDCGVQSIGPSSLNTGLYAHGITASAGVVNVYGGWIAVSGASSDNDGISTTGGIVNAYGTSIYPSAGGTFNFDLFRSSGTLYAANVIRTDATAITTFGTITYPP